MIKLSEFYTDIILPINRVSNRHIEIINLDFGGINKNDLTICNMFIKSKTENKEYSFSISLKTKKSLLDLANNEYIYDDFIISKTDLDRIYIYDCIILLEFIITEYEKLGAVNYSSLLDIDKFHLALFRMKNYKSNKGNL